MKKLSEATARSRWLFAFSFLVINFVMVFFTNLKNLIFTKDLVDFFNITNSFLLLAFVLYFQYHFWYKNKKTFLMSLWINVHILLNLALFLFAIILLPGFFAWIRTVPPTLFFGIFVYFSIMYLVQLNYLIVTIQLKRVKKLKVKK